MFTLILLHIFFVSFTDKPEMTTPALSERAIEQREKWDIALDELDYPVYSGYTDSLQRMGVQVHHTSRWFNGATCEMSAALAEEVERLYFVSEVEMTRDDSSPIYAPSRMKRQLESVETTDEAIISQTSAQLNVYNLRPLHQAGFHGQGILMTICDDGFYNANTLECFRQSQLLGHFDWTDDDQFGYSFFGSTGAHGTQCLSAISGIQEGFYGAATQAEYYLMRSEEYKTESPKEMDNLVAALEKSDSLGVNVFSVSLGYAYFDNDAWTLPYAALDGKSTRASLAATIAARKGMLVCVAAGNEGNNSWHTICVPADADSILTVGAVDIQRHIGTFSSYGPSADGRTKPDVCAVGVQATLINPYGNIIQSNGTSFATPLLAGLAATLWSALPDENAMQIRERIIQSADRYDNPDTDQYGYGIPDAWKAYMGDSPETTGTVKTNDVNSARKVIHGEQILIMRHGHIYNLAGQMVR